MALYVIRNQWNEDIMRFSSDSDELAKVHLAVKKYRGETMPVYRQNEGKWEFSFNTDLSDNAPNEAL